MPRSVPVRWPLLIPSIDLMGARSCSWCRAIKQELEFDNFDYWIERFSKYPLVQLIDLDAARGMGDNRPRWSGRSCNA